MDVYAHSSKKTQTFAIRYVRIILKRMPTHKTLNLNSTRRPLGPSGEAASDYNISELE
jgi:hypothetical protein